MKSDYIEVTVDTGPVSQAAYRVTATKAGRSVRKVTRTRSKVQWLDIEELTRTGKPTGNSLSVRMQSVVAVTEVHSDPPNDRHAPRFKVKRPPKLVPQAQTSLGLAAVGVQG